MYLLFITLTIWSPQNVYQRSRSGPRSAMLGSPELDSNHMVNGTEFMCCVRRPVVWTLSNENGDGVR